jgi:hypothetical protein
VRLLDPRWPRVAGAPATATAAVLALAAVGLGSALPRPAAAAEFPGPELLRELQTRLVAPADCLPACAEVARLHLRAEPQRLSLELEVHALAPVAVPLPGAGEAWRPATVQVDGAPLSPVARDDEGGLWVVLSPGIRTVRLEGPLPPRDQIPLSLALVPRHTTVEASGWAVEGLDGDGRSRGQLQLTRVRQAELGPAPLEPTTLPPLVQVERTLRLGLEWVVETQVHRLSPPGSAVVLDLALIEGESVTTEGVRAANGRVSVTLGPEQVDTAWAGTLDRRPARTLTAATDPRVSELWRVEVGQIWHLATAGIPVVHHQDPRGYWLPTWQPWPGEQVTLRVTRPEGVAGRTLTIDGSRLEVRPGHRATDGELQVTLRASQGGQHTLLLPPDAELQSVQIDGRAQPVRQDGRRVTVPVRPDRQTVTVAWRSAEPVTAWLRTPGLDLGAPSVNHDLGVSLGEDRWVLLTGGPRLGPAVLFWGVVVVVVLVSVALGRVGITPLRWYHWLLLGLGLTQTGVETAVLVVGWLLALGLRARLAPPERPGLFDTLQVGLAVLTVLALGALVGALQQGLLGLPEMQVAGNGSTAYALRWYQDRAGPVPPTAWVLSVPLLAYRLAMLAWALWLAFAVLRWLAWGWHAYGAQGVWRPLRWRQGPRRQPVTDLAAGEGGQGPQAPGPS